MHASFVAGVGALIIAAFNASAQTGGTRTYANPIDIDYRYNFEQLNQGISYRSGADPVIVVHRGEYYLFETIGEGYWRSRDLGTWEHITPSRWPLGDIVAPAALSVRDTIYLLPSTTRPLPILMLTEPATGRVEFYNRLLPWLPMARSSEPGVFAKPDSVQPGPWDPQFFHDPDTTVGSFIGTHQTCIHCTSSSSTRRNASRTKARHAGYSDSNRKSTGGSDSVRTTATLRSSHSWKARG